MVLKVTIHFNRMLQPANMNKNPVVIKPVAAVKRNKQIGLQKTLTTMQHTCNDHPIQNSQGTHRSRVITFNNNLQQTKGDKTLTSRSNKQEQMTRSNNMINMKACMIKSKSNDQLPSEQQHATKHLPTQNFTLSQTLKTLTTNIKRTSSPSSIPNEGILPLTQKL